MIKIKLPRGCFMAILVFYSPVIIGMSFSSEPDVRNPGLFGSSCGVVSEYLANMKKR
jgi:hypothetical protein